MSKILLSNEKENLGELIERLKTGDESAFEEIYNRCNKHIAFVCSKFCITREDVEEVVQDTFLVVFKKSDELIGETFLTYLRKIAVNLCYQKHKKNSRNQEFVVTEEEIENQIDIDADFLPESYLENKEKQGKLLSIIDSLPKNQREAVYLYYYFEIKTEEIARLLDCEAGNVRIILHRARKTIKSKLEGVEDADNRKWIKGMALVPLADVFFMEEQAFIAGYIDTVAVSASSIGSVAKLNIASKISKSYVVACAVIVCVACVTLYFVLQQENAGQEIVEMQTGNASSESYEQNYETYNSELDNEYEPQSSEVYNEDEQQAIDINGDYEAQTSDVNTKQEPQTVEVDTEQEHQAAENVQEPESPVVEQDREDNAEIDHEENTTEESESELAHVDRTTEILTALASASTRGDVDRIVSYFGFDVANQMRRSTDERLRFYVTNEGSGDILIGTAMHEDGSGWRMRFQHFSNGKMNLDTFELFHFMEY